MIVLGMNAFPMISVVIESGQRVCHCCFDQDSCRKVFQENKDGEVVQASFSRQIVKKVLELFDTLDEQLECFDRQVLANFVSSFFHHCR